MRILVANKFYYRKGGAETYLFELMAVLQAHDHEVIPFAMRHESNVASDYGSFFVDQVDYNNPGPWHTNLRAAGRILYSRHAQHKIAALLEQTRPHLAHVHNIYHQISPSILPVFKQHGIPVIMTLHDLKLLCPNYKMRTHSQICERCKPRKFYHALLHRCVKDSFLASAVSTAEMYLHRYAGIYEKNVETFIAPCHFYRQKMIEWGIPEEKLVCMPYCIHADRYLPVYKDKNYFIYFGRLSEEKGLLTLLEAMRRLRKGTLYIVGDGPLRGVLGRAIAMHGLHNVQLTGAKWGEELLGMIGGSRFTVVPSEWYENNPLSIMESYACGKPVVGANIGGIPEMIEDGRTGLLFEPFSSADLAEKIGFLLEDDRLAVEMGKHARAKAEQEYSPERHYAGLMRVYTEALAGRNGW